MSNFDTNKWFRITDTDDVLSLVGTYLFEHSVEGTAFMRVSDSSDPEQLWQIWPYDSNFLALRTQASGSTGYLGATIGSTTESAINSGNTTPYVANATIVDESSKWQIKPWGDGTFFFVNSANGSDWHMHIQDNGLLSMSSDTQSKSGQQFKFRAVDNIDDDAFSTFATPAALVSSTPTPTPTPSSDSSSTSKSNPSSTQTLPSASLKDTSPSDSDSSSGLSVGAQAGIGVAVAVLVIAAIVAALFFWRRRRRAPKDASPAESYNYNPPVHAVPQGNQVSQITPYPPKPAPTAELADSHRIGGVNEYYGKSERAKYAPMDPPQPPVELPASDARLELPTNKDGSPTHR